MPNDRKVKVSFSANAEDYIRRFMKVAERTMPNASLVPIFTWYISGKSTNTSTGEVTKYGPGVDVGAIHLKDLAVIPIRPAFRRAAGPKAGGGLRATVAHRGNLPDD